MAEAMRGDVDEYEEYAKRKITEAYNQLALYEKWVLISNVGILVYHVGLFFLLFAGGSDYGPKTLCVAAIVISFFIGVSSLVLHKNYVNFSEDEFPGRPTMFAVVLPVLALIFDGLIFLFVVFVLYLNASLS